MAEGPLGRNKRGSWLAGSRKSYLQYIFERTWNFLGLESQIPKAHDYLTTYIAKTPVVVTRGAKGEIGAFINACRHKGATVARFSQGNAEYHVCPYHGWAYDASGKNVDIKDRKAGCYAEAFDQDNHDLLPIAKVARQGHGVWQFVA